MKKFFKKIKAKLQALFRKLGGAEKNIPEFVAINIYYNDILQVVYENISPDLKANICDIIKEFAKNNDYEILYDFPARIIHINFNVKKK